MSLALIAPAPLHGAYALLYTANIDW